MAWQNIHDDGDLRKYRTELPNMADDELGPYEYRLLGHYKRVCGGAPGGACWEEVRTTAERCKMSVGKVIQSRRALEEEGWITVAEQPRRNKRSGVVVRLVDRWLENFQRYAPSAPPKRPRDGVDNSPAGCGQLPLGEKDNAHLVNIVRRNVHQVSDHQGNVHQVSKPYRKVKKEPIQRSKKELLQPEEEPTTVARAREGEKGEKDKGKLVLNGNGQEPGDAGAAVQEPRTNAERSGAAHGPPSPYPLPQLAPLREALAAFSATLDEPYRDDDLDDMAAAARDLRLDEARLRQLIADTAERARNPAGWLLDSLLVRGDARPPRPRPTPKQPPRRDQAVRSEFVAAFSATPATLDQRDMAASTRERFLAELRGDTS